MKTGRRGFFAALAGAVVAVKARPRIIVPDIPGELIEPGKRDTGTIVVASGWGAYFTLPSARSDFPRKRNAS